MASDSNREPIAQQLNSIISTLDDIACQALDPKTFDEVAEEEHTLGAILTRVQLILGFADIRRSSEYRVIRGRQ